MTRSLRVVGRARFSLINSDVLSGACKFPSVSDVKYAAEQISRFDLAADCFDILIFSPHVLGIVLYTLPFLSNFTERLCRPNGTDDLAMVNRIRLEEILVEFQSISMPA